ncbi:MAG: 30S ribosomal protein S15 [Thermoprotei archaeon]
MNKNREKGKSHSTRPISPNENLVRRYKAEEVRSLIVNLARKGYSPSMIGIILRDQYGIPLASLVTGKSITQILKEENLAPQIPEDLSNLIKRAERVLRHLQEHPKDSKSLRGLEGIISKINRLTKYYKREGILPQTWEHGITLPR